MLCRTLRSNDCFVAIVMWLGVMSWGYGSKEMDNLTTGIAITRVRSCWAMSIKRCWSKVKNSIPTWSSTVRAKLSPLPPLCFTRSICLLSGANNVMIKSWSQVCRMFRVTTTFATEAELLMGIVDQIMTGLWFHSHTRIGLVSVVPGDYIPGAKWCILAPAFHWFQGMQRKS